MALVLAFKSAGAPKVLELQGVWVIFVTRFCTPFLVFFNPTLYWKSTWTFWCVPRLLKSCLDYRMVVGTIKEMEIWSENGKNISSVAMGESGQVDDYCKSWSVTHQMMAQTRRNWLTLLWNCVEFKSPIACNLALKLYEKKIIEWNVNVSTSGKVKREGGQKIFKPFFDVWGSRPINLGLLIFQLLLLAKLALARLLNLAKLHNEEERSIMRAF